MTKLLTPPATLSQAPSPQGSPLPLQGRADCVCVIPVNFTPPSCMRSPERLAQWAWGQSSLCQVLVGKQDLYPGNDCDPWSRRPLASLPEEL